MGLIVSRLMGTPEQTAWLTIRVDPAGLLYLMAALVAGVNFFGAMDYRNSLSSGIFNQLP